MRFVITLTDEEFATLSDRSKHLAETLVMRKPCDDIEVIIQREGDEREVEDSGKQWPLRDVLAKLAEAAQILLKEYDYDGHGWEEIATCVDRAQEILKTSVDTLEDNR